MAGRLFFLQISCLAYFISGVFFEHVYTSFRAVVKTNFGSAPENSFTKHKDSPSLIDFTQMRNYFNKDEIKIATHSFQHFVGSNSIYYSK